VRIREPPARDTTVHCQVHFSAAVWATGFYANLLIINSGTFIINGWVLRFTFPGDQIITPTTFFGGVLTQTGREVVISNGPFNARIDPFASTGAGFVGTYTGTFAAPTGYTLNGTPCDIV
jgi:hypothetical protein